jgi:hypothetical protein
LSLLHQDPNLDCLSTEKRESLASKDLYLRKHIILITW